MLSHAPIVTFLVSADLAAARTFYADVLGLTLTADEPDALVFQLLGATLRISRSRPLWPRRTPC